MPPGALSPELVAALVAAPAGAHPALLAPAATAATPFRSWAVAPCDACATEEMAVALVHLYPRYVAASVEWICAACHARARAAVLRTARRLQRDGGWAQDPEADRAACVAVAQAVLAGRQRSWRTRWRRWRRRPAVRVTRGRGSHRWRGADGRRESQ